MKAASQGRLQAVESTSWGLPRLLSRCSSQTHYAYVFLTSRAIEALVWKLLILCDPTQDALSSPAARAENLIGLGIWADMSVQGSDLLVHRALPGGTECVYSYSYSSF